MDKALKIITLLIFGAALGRAQILQQILTTHPPLATTYSIVNSQSVFGGGTSVLTASAPAFTNALTNGSTIIALVYSGAINSAIFSVTDTAGNTYVDCGPGKGNFGVSNPFECFYAKNTHTTSSNVVTVTQDNSGPYLSVMALEITGINRSAPVDGTAYSVKNATTGSSGANTLTANSITTTHADDFVLAQFTAQSGSTTGTSPNAFTATLAGSGYGEYFRLTTPGSITATAGSSSGGNVYGVIVVAFRH